MQRSRRRGVEGPRPWPPKEASGGRIDLGRRPPFVPPGFARHKKEPPKEASLKPDRAFLCGLRAKRSNPRRSEAECGGEAGAAELSDLLRESGGEAGASEVHSRVEPKAERGASD